MNPLISLVIPVYNVEKYLDKCMESVLAQTYDNFEVILVDDGSTDNSGKMCDEYAERDSRVTVYHKPNGGLSDARNFGVEHCNGELVSFFDSDDYMANFYLEYLWYLMIKYHADMSCSQSRTVYDYSPVEIDGDPIVEELLDTEQMLARICYTSVGADTRLYKKEHLIANPYPVGKLYEDLATTYRIVGQCKKIACSNKIIDFWVLRDGSITRDIITEKQFDIFDAEDELVKYYERYFPQIIKAAYHRGVMAGNAFMTRLFNYNKDSKKDYFYRARCRVKKYIWPVMFDRQTSIRLKIGGLAIWLGYIPSCLAWTIKKKRESGKGNLK